MESHGRRCPVDDPLYDVLPQLWEEEVSAAEPLRRWLARRHACLLALVLIEEANELVN